MNDTNLKELAKKIKVFVFDVDGIFSDGFIHISNQGDEIKSFDIRDGFGVKLLKKSGIEIAIITGKTSQIVQRRMQDLGIKHVIQGREDKGVALLELCDKLNISPEDCAYMGDDWPDLSAFALAAISFSVPNGHHEVQQRADIVTQAYGGRGAVREACDWILTQRDLYQPLLAEYLRTK